MPPVPAVLVLVSGMLAAVVLGKTGPVLGPLSDDLAVPTGVSGWLASSVTILAAVAGVPVARWAAARPPGPIVLGGVAVMGSAGLVSAAAGSAWTLLALRVAEGIGYVGTVVVGPMLLAGLRDAAQRRTALAWWGAGIPLGLALASAGGGLSAALGWRWWFAMVGLLCLGMAAASRTMLSVAAAPPAPNAVPAGPRAVVPARAPTRPPAGARTWLLAAGFAATSSVGVAVVTLLPLFLAEQHEVPLVAAGAATSAVAVASVPGSLLAGVLLRRGITVRPLFAAGCAMPVAAAGVVLGGSPGSAVAWASMLLVVNGVTVSGFFAAVPVVAAGPVATALAAGALTQSGSLGTLLGAPVLATVAERLGWPAVVPVVAVLALAGAGCAFAATHRRPG